jgi:hypothetical protein
MIDAKDAVVWVNNELGEVLVRPHSWGVPEDHGRALGWSDPIGAAYAQWREMKNAQRVQLMLETALDLAMQGIPLDRVLRAFAPVTKFRALGGKSFPMCRAMTQVLVGRRLEAPERFEELVAARP